MSNAAIGEVIALLQALPDSDQQAALQFLLSLKNRPNPKSASSSSQGNPALSMVDGSLVFTGQISEPATDWLKIIRDERDQEFLSSASVPDGPP